MTLPEDDYIVRLKLLVMNCIYFFSCKCFENRFALTVTKFIITAVGLLKTEKNVQKFPRRPLVSRPDVLIVVSCFIFIQVVMDFKVPGKVYTAAMSPVATTHMLIATGSADVQDRLCDIASGAFTHMLSGHRG